MHQKFMVLVRKGRKKKVFPWLEVIERFKSDLDMATYIVGHNIEFDKKIVGAEMIRLGMKDIMDSKKSYCTMQSSIDFVRFLESMATNIPRFTGTIQKTFWL